MIHRQIHINQNFALSILLIVGLVWVGSSTALAASVSRDYGGVEESVKLGSLVALDKSNPSKIELMNVNNRDYAVGVVVEQGKALLSMSLSSGENVVVATEGEVVALVTDSNGVVKKGDFVGASNINGVAMKIDDQSAETQRLIGIALQDFDSSLALSVDGESLVSDAASIKVGYMPISIINKDRSANLGNGSDLESIAGRLAGKNVSMTKVLIAFGIFALGIVIAAMVIVGSVKGSFVSLGRNPLAKSSIYVNLVHVSILTIAITLIGAALAYVVLVI